MTRSKELRRIETAISDGNENELKWALGQCELRKKFLKGHSDLWYRLEKRIRAALDEARSKSS